MMVKTKMSKERKKLINFVRKDLNYKGKILTPSEHKKLVTGKKIVFSKEFIKNINKYIKENSRRSNEKERLKQSKLFAKIFIEMVSPKQMKDTSKALKEFRESEKKLKEKQ